MDDSADLADHIRKAVQTMTPAHTERLFEGNTFTVNVMVKAADGAEDEVVVVVYTRHDWDTLQAGTK